MKASDPAVMVRDWRVNVRLASLPHGALLIDRQGRIVASNAAARRIFGDRVDHPDAVNGPDGVNPPDGRPISELIPDLAASDVQILLRSRKRPKRRELRGVRGDGSRFPLRVGFSRVRSGRVPALLLTVGDLTSRKAMEAVVRDSRYGFRQLAQALPHVLCTFNPDGSAEYFGPQWIAFTGVALESQLGSGWLRHAHVDDRPALTQAWNAAVAGGETFKSEFRVRRHDGEYHWFESTVVPVRDRDGIIVRWIGILNDIHEARENRMALIEERDRFSRLVASAPGAVYAYRLHPDGSTTFPLASPGIRDLVGVSAEELARSAASSIPRVHPDDMPRIRESILKSAATLTPWHGEWRVLHPQKGEIWAEAHSVPIAGNARLAMADLPQDHVVRSNLAEIDRASARATNLVHRILAFSRQTEPRREVIQLRPTIEEALRLLRATLPAMIEIKTDFAGDVPAVDADSTQIHQIIMNLITNSALRPRVPAKVTAKHRSWPRKAAVSA